MSMWIDVHAVLLALLPVATVFAVATMKRRSPTNWRLAVPTIVALLAMVVVWGLNGHLCLEGRPRSQWLIGGLCMLLVLAGVKSVAQRRVLAGVLFVLMLGLSCHFTDVVHTSDWTGNPMSKGPFDAFQRSIQKTAALLPAEVEDASVSYAAGWLRESPVWVQVKSQLGDRYYPRRQIDRAWHTGLTGLHPVTLIPQDIWYPGGVFADNVGRIELRDRPDRQD